MLKPCLYSRLKGQQGVWGGGGWKDPNDGAGLISVHRLSPRHCGLLHVSSYVEVS
jgi:hypothetical protein